MICYICGRNTCLPSWHSPEQIKAFEPAEEAYDRFIEIREECKRNWFETETENQEEQDNEK